ncbi:uncharacterized protein LOC122967796, partial [Scomber scombrus]
MTPWQILQASKASRAALGSPAHHGHTAAVQYSIAEAAPDGSRTFCVSTDRLTMQELNGRLASYLQQVQCLEAANQQLECQILQELDRKCPADLTELDGHLQTVSQLQDQISECLSVQAELKLLLLNEELHACNFKVRWESEQENRGRLEAELQKLRLQGEGLLTQEVPELQELHESQRQQMMELQIQHQQNVQGLLDQVTRGINVQMQLIQSADLNQQLNNRRHTNATMFDHNQDECWFNDQEPTVTFDPPEVSEDVMIGLNQLRTTAASLEEELMLLQAENMQLESCEQQQMDSFVQQLEFLQKRADSLSSDLDSAMQVIAQQAANHQDLLDVKIQLENEIQNYRMLLEGRGCQWVCKPADMSFCAPSNTAAISFLGGNLNMGAVQTKGFIGTVQHAPVYTPLSGTVTRVESVRVESNSPLTLINTSNLTGCQSENPTTGVLSDRTKRVSTTTNRWSSLVEDKAQATGPEYFSLKQTTSGVGLKEGTSTKKDIAETITGAHVKQETHFITQIDDKNKKEVTVEGTSLVHTLDQSLSMCNESISKQNNIKEDAVVASGLPTGSSCSANSNDIFVRESLTASAGTLRKSVTMSRWSTLLEPTVPSVDHNLLNESVVSTQISQGVEESSVVPLKLETQAEVVRVAGEVTVTASEVSRSEGVQGEVSCEVTLIDDKKKEEVKVEGTSVVEGLDQSLSMGSESKRKQDVKKDADVVSTTLTASSCTIEKNDNLNSKTTSAGTLRKSVTMSRWSTLLEPTVPSIDHNLINESVSTQISQGVQESSVVPLKLETQAEVVRDAGKVTVTASEVSRSEGVQGEVSCEVTLIDDKKKEEVEVKVEGTSVVQGLDQSLSMGSESKRKQDDMKKDADVVSTVLTASSCTIQRNDNLNSKTASAGTLRKSVTMSRWSTLLEPTVPFVDHNLINESVVGTQISQGVEESSVVSLKLETQAEVVRVAGEVTVTASEVSKSEGVQGEVSCEVILIDDKTKEEVKVEGTSVVHGLDQSLSMGSESERKQDDVKKDADVVSTTLTASSCTIERNDHLNSKTASTGTLRKSVTMSRWSTLLEPTVPSVDHNLVNESVVGTQISQGVEGSSVVSLKLETQAEVVRDAGEVTVTASEVSTSEGVQGEVSCEVTLIDDTKKEEVEVKVEGTSVVQGLDQSLSMGSESERKQDDVKKDADVASTTLTASSCTIERNDNLNSKTANAETLRKSVTMSRWSTLLEPTVPSVDHNLLNDSVSTQIIQRVEESSVVPLKLETQAEVVRDAGEVTVTASEVSKSEGVQGEVSCEVTLIDDKKKEEVEVKVEGTSVVQGLDQSLSMGSESERKQDDVKKDADVVSTNLTASSCTIERNDNLNSKTASAETLRKSMTMSRWSTLLEPTVPSVDHNLLNDSVSTEISQRVQESSVVSLKLETQAEVVRDAGEVTVTASEVFKSEGVQGEVSCEVTLIDDTKKEEVEVKVEGISVVHGLEQSLSMGSESKRKQDDVKKDADVVSTTLTASSCTIERNDNLNSKTASAETLRKSMTMSRWSTLLEPTVPSVDHNLVNES